MVNYKIMGIDEAGRGPVIGSLFIGFAYIVLEDSKTFDDYEKKLRGIGVKDSKQLSPKERNRIYNELKDNLDFKYVQLTPEAIDNNFFAKRTLNELQIHGIVHLINQEKPNLIIIDALTSDPSKYKQEILSKLEYTPDNIIAVNKADEKYAIVGAASIMAKELRELEVSDIKKSINIDCGSGYPADPKTKEFLKEHYDNKEFEFIFRKSWKTYQNLIPKKEEKSLNKWVK